MRGWLAASVLGFALAGLVFHFPGSFPVGSGGSTLQIGAAVFGALMGAVSGAISGVALWWSVRRLASPWLIAATAAGFGLIHALGDGLPTDVPYAIIGVAGGAVLGLAQAPALRPRVDTIAFAISSALGIGAGSVVGLAAIDVVGLSRQTWTPQVGALQHALASAAIGLLWGWSTGRRLFGRAPSSASASGAA